jgi:hypothetical protein
MKKMCFAALENPQVTSRVPLCAIGQLLLYEAGKQDSALLPGKAAWPAANSGISARSRETDEASTASLANFLT